ncbi:hypothetical protein AgCh_031022 [Apium graveolens]
MVDLFVKGLKKMVYKNFKKRRRFSRKGFSSSNSDKRNNRRNSDDGINYALMENADTEADNAKLKVPRTTLAFDTDDICELRLILKSLHVSYRDQTLENDRIKNENSKLKKRNDRLEIELLSCQKSKKKDIMMLILKKKLKTTKEILENGCWGSGLGYANRSNSEKKIEKETEKNKPVNTDTKVKLNKVQLKAIKFNPSADAVKSVNEVETAQAKAEGFTHERQRKKA